MTAPTITQLRDGFTLVNGAGTADCPEWCDNHEITRRSDGTVTEQCHLYERRLTVPGGAVSVTIVQIVGSGNEPECNLEFVPDEGRPEYVEIEGNFAAVRLALAAFHLALPGGAR